MAIFRISGRNAIVAFQLFLISLWGLTSQAHAAIAPGFFQSEQAVNNQSKAERTRAIQAGFEEILVKLAGSQEILSRPELDLVLQKPKAFLENFNYWHDLDSDQNFIRLHFNGRQIEALFFEFQLPLWPKNRPAIMIWFGLDDHALGRSIVSDANPRLVQYKATLQAHAQRRGLRLIWPSLDEQDQQAASLTDIWSMDMSAITHATKRYAAPIVLLGKANRVSSQSWYGQWGLEYEGRAHWFEGAGNAFEQVAHTIIETIAEQLSSSFALEAGSGVSQSVLLEINGVDSLQEYAKISELLTTLLPISHIVVKQALPSKLIFELQVQGGVNQLITSLQQQRQLQQIPMMKMNQFETPPGKTTDSSQTMIKYRWLGS